MGAGTILVTGAAGFIGSHLTEKLLAQGAGVVGVDNFDPFYDERLKRANIDEITSHPRADAFHLHEIDIRDTGAMRALCDATRPEGIIHIAARAGVRPSIEDPVGYADVNLVGTSVVLDAARRAGTRRVLVASSSSVYANNEKVPFSEGDNVEHPISPYAATKRACELLCHAHWSLTGMPTGCLRFFTVFGPRQRPDLAIRFFLDRVSRGEPIPFFGDGSTSRDYTYIDDIVSGILAAYDHMDEHGYRIWNLGGSDPVSLSDMVSTVGEVVGRSPILDRRPMQPGDVLRTWADLSRSRAELGYVPTTSLKAGLERQWAWMQTRARAE
jgi:UDP-glucuronate 4-epimerase